MRTAVRSLEFHGFSWWLPLCDGDLMDFFLAVPTELRNAKGLYARGGCARHVFTGPMARLAEIPPIGDGRMAWYGEPRPSRRRVLWGQARALAQAYRTAEPRVVRDMRLGWAVREFRPTDLRFEEWFVADAAAARTTKLRALMSSSEGPLAGLPPKLTDRFRSRQDYPLCFISPLALLTAAYLAEAVRSAASDASRTRRHSKL